MNGDEWCIDCYSHVHGAAVATDNQVCSLQEGSQLCQAGLTGKINSSFLHAPRDAFDDREVAGCSAEYNLCMLLAHQAINQRCPVWNGPALGLPIIGTDVADDHLFVRLHTGIVQQLLNLQLGLLIHVKMRNAILWSQYCS